MMQILNKVFMENEQAPFSQATFLEQKRESPYLACKRKGKSGSPLYEKRGRKKETGPFFPLFYPLLTVY